MSKYYVTNSVMNELFCGGIKAGSIMTPMKRSGFQLYLFESKHHNPYFYTKSDIERLKRIAVTVLSSSNGKNISYDGFLVDLFNRNELKVPFTIYNVSSFNKLMGYKPIIAAASYVIKSDAVGGKGGDYDGKKLNSNDIISDFINHDSNGKKIDYINAMLSKAQKISISKELKKIYKDKTGNEVPKQSETVRHYYATKASKD